MSQTLHIISMDMSDYDDYSSTIIGVTTDAQEAQDAVKAHMDALGTRPTFPKDVDDRAMMDAEKISVYTYPVELGQIATPPVLAYVTYAGKDMPVGYEQGGRVKTIFVDPDTGTDLLGSLNPGITLPEQTAKDAVANPDKAFAFPGKTYRIIRDSHIEQSDVTLYISLNQKELRKAAGLL